MIEPSKIVALGFDLSYMIKETSQPDKAIREKFQIEKLKLLRDIILYMGETDNKLPIYDFYTKREINKTKVLSLNL